MLTVLLLATPATQQIQKRQHPSKKIFGCTGMYLCTLLLNSKCSFFFFFQLAAQRHSQYMCSCCCPIFHFYSWAGYSHSMRHRRPNLSVHYAWERPWLPGLAWLLWNRALDFLGGLTFSTLNLCCKTAEAFVLETHKEAVFFFCSQCGRGKEMGGRIAVTDC